MKTKYDWSGVELRVKWIATDADGNMWKYEEKHGKPFPYDGDKVWTCGGNYLIHQFVGVSNFEGNWQDSLEERPNE